jgi:peptide/nickel transport system substrate-binding protein
MIQIGGSMSTVDENNQAGPMQGAGPTEDGGAGDDAAGDAVTPRTVISRRNLLQGAAAMLAVPAAGKLLGPTSRIAERPGLALPSLLPRRSGTLRVAASHEPAFIDPAYALEVDEFAVVRNVYDGLVQWNVDENHLESALALSWSSNSQATEWTFHLRKDVTFHDGTPFNSAAMKQTILHYQPSTWGFLFANLTTIDDSNPHVLKLKFSLPSPDMARNNTFLKAISPKLLKAGQASKRSVGTGAFKFDRWVHGQEIDMSANPGYWGKGPLLSKVQLKTVLDETARVQGLESGSLDLITRVDPHDVASLRSNPSTRVSQLPTWFEYHLTFRCDQPITSNTRVRQAIAYAVDREAIVKDVLLGQGAVAPTPIPNGCYGHIVPPTKYTYNPGKARKLLKEAGYPNGISLAMTTPVDFQLVGEAMVPQMAEAGIKVNFKVLDIGVVVSDLVASHPKHQLFILHYGWVNGGPFHFDAETIISHPQYKGAQLVGLIKASNTTPDGAKRLNLLHQAQDLFMKVLPHLPLYYAEDADAFASKVHGYQTPRDAYMPVFTRVSV